MELISYDEATKTSTLKLTDSEFVDLNELLIGVVNTDQDYTVLGLSEGRLSDIKDELLSLFRKRLTYRTRAKI